jgi:hypothetical protein
MDGKIKGMPDRSGIKLDSVGIEDDDIEFNPFLSEYDDNICSGLDGIDDDNIGAGIKDIANETCKHQDILKLNDLVYQGFKRFTNNFLFNGSGLQMLFALLYPASSGNSLILMRDFFNFSKPLELIKEWDDIDSITSSINHNCMNMLLINPKYKISKRYLTNASMLLNTKIVKGRDSGAINRLLPGNNIVSNRFKVNNVVLFSYCNIKPKWKHPTFNITVKNFCGSRHKYMHKVDEVIGYTSDEDFALYEIELKDDWAMGFVTSEDNNPPELTLTELNYYWKLMEYNRAQSIYIPIFKQSNKHKYNSLLKQGGLSKFLPYRRVSPKAVNILHFISLFSDKS